MASTFLDVLHALDLARKMDVDEADRTGSCTLTFGAALSLTIERDQEGQLLRLYAPVGVVRPDARAAIARRVLALHDRDSALCEPELLGGATVSPHYADQAATNAADSMGVEHAYFGYETQLDQMAYFASIDMRSASLEHVVSSLTTFVTRAMAHVEALPRWQ